MERNLETLTETQLKNLVTTKHKIITDKDFFKKPLEYQETELTIYKEANDELAIRYNC